jgi:hypothetical protein
MVLLALITFLIYPQITLAEPLHNLGVSQNKINNEEIMSSPESSEMSAQNSQNFGGNSRSAIIILKTACEKDAETTSNIQAQISKAKGGYTNWVTLDNSGNDRKKCAEDYYNVNFSDEVTLFDTNELPLVENLRLRTDSKYPGRSWKLAWAEVSIPGKKERKTWNIWLGDKKYKDQWCVYVSQGPIDCP